MIILKFDRKQLKEQGFDDMDSIAYYAKSLKKIVDDNIILVPQGIELEVRTDIKSKQVQHDDNFITWK